MNVNTLNGLTLAYIGDSVYELYIRNHIVSLGYTKVNDLHKHAVLFTSGLNQAKIVRYLIANNYLNDEEFDAFKHGRNSHVNTTRKSISLKDYLDATGFEAMIGYLYLSDKKERLNEIFETIIKIRGVLND